MSQPATPDNDATMVEILRRRADKQPGKTVFTFLADGETDERCLTYARLDERARAIGRWLQERGAAGERVMILCPQGLEFIEALFGCFYAGAIAVPGYPPKAGRTMGRLETIATDCGARFAFTIKNHLSVLETALGDASVMRAMKWMAVEGIEDALAGGWEETVLTTDSLAFLQYTSGSTATPRGEMISHGNILGNSRCIWIGGGHTPETVMVSWLPMFHDAGLVGKILQPVCNGLTAILLSPGDFLQKPVRWLQAISRYRGTSSCAPNFAYDLCVQRVTAEQKASLDLSTWASAWNGAEPVRRETIDRFSASFRDCGFRAEAMYPCYGLAETTVISTGGRHLSPPVFLAADADALERHSVQAPAAAAKTRNLVGCGSAFESHRVVIVDPDRHTPDRKSVR